MYESYNTRAGVKCVVRVNNREYHTDTTYENEVLANENAAMRAYLICRNFSVSDGMYPPGHKAGSVLQGMPVAIGTERRNVYNEDQESSSSGSQSGGSSPGSAEFPSSFRGNRRRNDRNEVNRVLTYNSSSTRRR